MDIYVHMFLTIIVLLNVVKNNAFPIDAISIEKDVGDLICDEVIGGWEKASQ